MTRPEQIGAFDVQILVLSNRQQNRRHAVDQYADAGGHHHRPAGRGGAVDEFADAFIDDEPDGGQQNGRIDKGREDGRLAEAVGERCVRASLQQQEGGQRDDEAPHVAQIMAGVRHQADGIPSVAKKEFRRDIDEIDDDGDDEASSHSGIEFVMMHVAMPVGMHMTVFMFVFVFVGMPFFVEVGSHVTFPLP